MHLQLSKDCSKLLFCQRDNKEVERTYFIYGIYSDKDRPNQKKTLKEHQAIKIQEGQPCPVFSKNLDYFVNYSDENHDILRTKDNTLVT